MLLTDRPTNQRTNKAEHNLVNGAKLA